MIRAAPASAKAIAFAAGGAWAADAPCGRSLSARI